jgi:hypothetical protein
VVTQASPMGVSAKILEDLVLAKIIGLLQTVIAPDTTSERILCKALKTLPESTILSLASIATNSSLQQIKPAVIIAHIAFIQSMSTNYRVIAQIPAKVY